MFKHFSIGIFLTTLVIVSMTHAISQEFYAEMQKLANDKPHLRTDLFGTGAPSPAATKAPMTVTSNDLSKFQVSGNTRLRQEDFNAFESGVMKIQGKPDTKESSVGKCRVDGQWVTPRPGKTCNSMVQDVNTGNRSQYTQSLSQIPRTRSFQRSPSLGSLWPQPTQEANTSQSSSSPINQITETLSPSPSLLPLPTASQPLQPQAGSFKLDKISGRFHNSGKNDNTSDTAIAKEESTSAQSTNSSSNDLDTPIIRETTITSPIDDYFGAYAPVNTPSLINNNMGNPTTTIPKSQSFLQPGSKKYTLPNGNVVEAELPKEIPVQYHSYERPLGLTQSEVDKIRNQVLAQNNYYRSKYGIQPLKPNKDMNNHAQEWANTLAPMNRLRSRSSTENNLYGQNMFASEPIDNIGKEAVNTWYNELRFIKVTDGEEELRDNPKNIGHLVTLLWKGSREIGIGVAKSDNNMYFIVADYNPRGDIYPFLKDNLPEFQQSDIDEAIYAHAAKPGEVKVVNSSDSPSLEGTVITTTEIMNDPNDYYKNIREPKLHPYEKPLGMREDEVELIRQDVFRKSNYYRKLYNMPELVLNDQINHYSQQWANTLGKTENKFQHRPDDGTRIYGENLHRSNDFLHIGEIAVDLWYYEIGLVHENDTEEDLFNNNDAGHLTQLLWRRSNQMGCGAARYPDGKVIIACNYNPTGNVQGLYLDNLPKFTKDQIEEGKRLQKVIDDQKLKRQPVPAAGQKRRLSGWKSALYVDP